MVASIIFYLMKKILMTIINILRNKNSVTSQQILEQYFSRKCSVTANTEYICENTWVGATYAQSVHIYKSWEWKMRKRMIGVVKEIPCTGEQIVEKLKYIIFTAVDLQTDQHIPLGFREQCLKIQGYIVLKRKTS